MLDTITALQDALANRLWCVAVGALVICVVLEAGGWIRSK